MENEKRIVELLAESLLKQDQMIDEQKQTNKTLYLLDDRTSKVEEQMIYLNNQIAKLNLQTAENTRAILTLADKIEKINDLENRVRKIEGIVLK
jgi:septal ring factor EnvC (AmiA/AmiB activator)